MQEVCQPRTNRAMPEQIEESKHVPDCAVVGAFSLVDAICCDLSERWDADLEDEQALVDLRRDAYSVRDNLQERLSLEALDEELKALTALPGDDRRPNLSRARSAERVARILLRESDDEGMERAVVLRTRARRLVQALESGGDVGRPLVRHRVEEPDGSVTDRGVRGARR